MKSPLLSRYNLFFLGFFISLLISQSPNEAILSKIDEALWLMDQKQYEFAYVLWSELLEQYDSNNAYWNYNAGYSLLHSRYSKKNALKYLKKAIGSISQKYNPDNPINTNAPPEALYYLGRAFHINSEWDSAIYYFEQFRNVVGMKHNLIPEMNLYYQYCLNGKELSKTQAQVIKITHLGESINSEYADYTPVLSLDEKMIFFTSKRPRENILEPNPIDPATNLFLEDIYYSYKKITGEWELAKIFPFYSNQNDAVVSINPTGNILYIYRDDNGDGNLYYSFLSDTGFSQLEKLPFPINTKYYEGHITFSPDEREAIFTSDRPGGLGGVDLWIIKKLPNEEWSGVTNLGPNINTPYNEDAPFWFIDAKTLYFSSQGHKSIGGYDIFYSERNDTGGWGKPVNVGLPINTPDDDVFAFFSSDGKRIYFSSVRDDSYGEKDIYVAELAIEEEKPVALLTGEIAFEGDTLPRGIRILAYDISTYQLVAESRPNIYTKSFYIPLMTDKRYLIAYMFNNDTLSTEEIYVPPATGYNQIKKMLTLKGATLQLLSEKKPSEEEITFNLKSIQFPKIFPANVVIKLLDENNNVLISQPLPRSGRFKLAKLEAYKSQQLKYFEIISPIEGLIECDKITTEIKNEKNEIVGRLKLIEGCKFEIEYLTPLSSASSSTTQKPYLEVTSFHQNEPVEKITKTMEVEEKKKEVIQELAVATTSKKASFKKYFKYNQVQIDTTDQTWLNFISLINEKISERKGQVNVYIEASASKVPTRTFISNERLARERGEAALRLLKSYCESKGIPSSKINLKAFSGLIQGPEYSPLNPPNIYEEFQYVVITVE